MGIFGLNVLDRLAMLAEDVYVYNSLVKLRVCALRDVVVEMLLIPQFIHPFEAEIEKGLQVLGAGTGDEYVGVPVRECRSDGKTQHSRLSSSTSSCKHDRRRLF